MLRNTVLPYLCFLIHSNCFVYLQDAVKTIESQNILCVLELLDYRDVFILPLNYAD